MQSRSEQGTNVEWILTFARSSFSLASSFEFSSRLVLRCAPKSLRTFVRMFLISLTT